VSPAAQRIYDALARRGYVVERQPSVPTPKQDGSLQALGEAVYTVKPPESIASDERFATAGFDELTVPIRSLADQVDDAAQTANISELVRACRA
jgi:hypothetical protein